MFILQIKILVKRYILCLTIIKKNGNGIKYLAFLIIDKLDLTNSFKIIYNLINIINLNLYLYQKLGCTIGFDQTFLTLILWFNRYYTTFL